MQTLDTKFTRFRGDTYPIRVLFPSLPVMTDFVVILSISDKQFPATADYVLQKQAAIDNTNKQAVFNFSAADMNHVGSFYYDIEVRTAGKVYTVAKGTFVFVQDITKESV